MGRQIKGLLYFSVMDIRFSLMVFWTILLSILVLSLAISYFLLSIDDAEFFFGFPFAVYSYSAILGFISVKESIPFAIKMGATRKNVFVSLGLFFLGISIVQAVATSTLQYLVTLFAKSAGITTFKFLHPATFVEDTWITRVAIDVSIMFFLLAFMFVLGLLFYKYGLAGGGSFAGILILLLLFSIAKGSFFRFLKDIFTNLDITLFLQILLTGLVIYAISFLLLRKITAVKKR